MARHELEITRTAEKKLQSLPLSDQQRVAAAMRKLATDPRPRGCRKLTGYDDIFRIRVGRYRIIYSVEDSKLIILILKIGHRQDIYQ